MADLNYSNNLDEANRQIVLKDKINHLKCVGYYMVIHGEENLW